jgi:hypothetical protein
MSTIGSTLPKGLAAPHAYPYLGYGASFLKQEVGQFPQVRTDFALMAFTFLIWDTGCG